MSDDRDHGHYGAETQQALKLFQEMWLSYNTITRFNFKENSHRLDSVQAAWDSLARARKTETGTGFYLNSQEYQNVNAG
jgi:hypothetical protein